MTRDEIFARVRAILAETFELEVTAITPSALLYEDLDLDSIDGLWMRSRPSRARSWS